MWRTCSSSREEMSEGAGWGGGGMVGWVAWEVQYWRGGWDEDVELWNCDSRAWLFGCARCVAMKERARSSAVGEVEERVLVLIVVRDHATAVSLPIRLPRSASPRSASSPSKTTFPSCLHIKIQFSHPRHCYCTLLPGLTTPSTDCDWCLSLAAKGISSLWSICSLQDIGREKAEDDEDEDE